MVGSPELCPSRCRCRSRLKIREIYFKENFRTVAFKIVYLQQVRSCRQEQLPFPTPIRPLEIIYEIEITVRPLRGLWHDDQLAELFTRRSYDGWRRLVWAPGIKRWLGIVLNEQLDELRRIGAKLFRDQGESHVDP
jgi:hypothetical protein